MKKANWMSLQPVGNSDRFVWKATGEEVLTHAGKISHAQAMEKAKAEYKRYQAQTVSPVEEEYLQTIKQLGEAAKTKAKKQADGSDLHGTQKQDR